MSKETIPLYVDDVSAFARSLAKQLEKTTELPSHLSLMNMLARAGGYTNYQHLRTQKAVMPKLESQSEPENREDTALISLPFVESPHTAKTEAINLPLVEKTLRQFDTEGKLTWWHAKRSVQDLSIWALWAQLPAGMAMHEREISERLNHLHRFEDAALLRRRLVGLGLFTRNEDGSNYRRVELKPTADGLALIRRLKVAS
ncbi:DUF2087 domain-containing protein [Thiofilum flexile]|uniref:DUF2087 domain-containing protein n=1 Tax=Thiofilum flexile TaxID=125627 RepID=UPI0003640C32|nr:DUF2087 domain-containing protein [Thiofilum flexile]